MIDFTQKQINAKTMEDFKEATQEMKDTEEYQEALQGFERCVSEGARKHFKNILNGKFGVGDLKGQFNK